MTAISSRARSLLLLVSAACYLASFWDAGEPLDARALERKVHLVVAESPAPPVAVDDLVRRDPFLADATAPPIRQAPFPVDDGPIVPDIDPRADGRARPATEASLATPETFVVRATIVGRRPMAFVAGGRDGETIVGIGDSLGGARVRAIDLRGIALADGTRLDLPEGYLATPAPKIRSESRSDAALDAVASLRTLLLRSQADRVPAFRERGAREPATPAAPTPAPLRTVDARGLLPGVNPTPDVTDPTAEPYPYPYAPVPH